MSEEIDVKLFDKDTQKKVARVLEEAFGKDPRLQDTVSIFVVAMMLLKLQGIENTEELFQQVNTTLNQHLHEGKA